MKVPFYHRNIDFDEVLFYHAGNFFSREGISAGAVTLHPQGIHHGPHPNAAKNAADKTETEKSLSWSIRIIRSRHGRRRKRRVPRILHVLEGGSEALMTLPVSSPSFHEIFSPISRRGFGTVWSSYFLIVRLSVHIVGVTGAVLHPSCGLRWHSSISLTTLVGDLIAPRLPDSAQKTLSRFLHHDRLAVPGNGGDRLRERGRFCSGRVPHRRRSRSFGVLSWEIGRGGGLFGFHWASFSLWQWRVSWDRVLPHGSRCRLRLSQNSRTLTYTLDAVLLFVMARAQTRSRTSRCVLLPSSSRGSPISALWLTEFRTRSTIP